MLLHSFKNQWCEIHKTMKLSTIILVVILPVFSKCTYFNVVDLTFGYDETAINFPGSQPFRWLKKWAGKDPNGVWYSSNDFKTGEHCGTHMDAPYHFDRIGKTIDEIPIQRLFPTGILINATLETGFNPWYKLPVQKINEWEAVNGRIPENCLVFINFGWSKKFYHNRRLYLGPTENDLRFPGISPEAASWIANTRKVVGVAVDVASADPGIHTEAHETLLKNDKYIIENINFPVSLPPKFYVIALPMKLINGTGAPVRVLALF